jgi:hypothetical protein
LLSLASVATAIGACEPAPELATSDALVFEPAAVDFGLQPVEEVAVRRVDLVNRGSVSLRIVRVRFEPDSPAFQLVPDDDRASLIGLVLRPNVPVPVEVRFGPVATGALDVAVWVETDVVAAQLSIASDAARVEPIEVETNPTSLDWGEVVLGERVERELSVRNRGAVSTRLVAFASEAPLLVTDEGASVALPTSLLAPGEERSYLAVLAPDAPVVIDAPLEIGLSGGGVVRVPVRADVQPAGAWSCPPVLDFGSLVRGETRTTTMQCRATGGVLRTTDVELMAGTAPGFELVGWSESDGTLDIELRYVAYGLAGAHAGAVRIATSHGATAEVPLAAETQAPPAGSGALAAVLEWDTNRLDLDLHLVRSGADPFSAGDDCYWGDKNPSWGLQEDFFDDPFLDRDATAGFGPEEVNLTEAAESRYDLYVQYHDFESVFGERATEATVHITTRGALTETRSRRLETCGLLWHVARVVDGRLEWIDTVDERVRELAAPKCR